ncbi:MAG: metal ABC transporter substrate-binding protein [Nitrosopumilaceae archaeon]
MDNQVKIAIISILIVIPLSCFSVWASDSNLLIEDEIESNKIQVIASFYPLYEFAQKVSQGRADVKLLVPEGVEPHDWEPTIQDVQKMQKADLIVINGLGFENWVDNLEEMNYQGIIVDTSDGIIKNKIFENDPSNDQIKDIENKHHPADPHIWLNPIFAKTQVQNIADSFSKLDPQHKDFYQRNAKNYKDDLDELDLKIRNDLSKCNHDFITFHDAFSYFADEYDLNQHTIISSNSPHSEPTAKTLEKIIKTSRELNIKIIFTEDTIDPRISEVVANEIGGKILVLSPLEFSGEGDYISKMTENLEQLRVALC